MDSSQDLPPLHVEIVQKRESTASKEHVKELVHSYLSGFASLTPGAVLGPAELEGALREHAESVALCDAEHEAELRPGQVELRLHVHTLDAFGPERDCMADGGEEVACADVWALPCEQFRGLWGSLVFDSRLKEDTLHYAEAAFEFAERGVDPDVVAWNRVLLLHGPPGTGKTSLCRALAHKLAVRLGDRFPRARLFELNAHALFSKWFSESGKLVARAFERVRDAADDPRALCVLLLDEVESLAHARAAALAGLEPSDAVRAVNAALAELDRLRRRRNALVLATTNLTAAVDAAFLDRCDVRRLVGRPSARAAYEILRGCCEELMRRALVAPREAVFSARVLEAARWAAGEGSRASLRLWAVASAATRAGLSARALRRLPLLARALHLPRDAPLPAFLDALHAALDDYLRDEQDLGGPVPPGPAQPAPAPGLPAPAPTATTVAQNGQWL